MANLNNKSWPVDALMNPQGREVSIELKDGNGRAGRSTIHNSNVHRLICSCQDAGYTPPTLNLDASASSLERSSK
jgi:hypothetical protein